MGVPAPAGVGASGRSPYWPADKANGVIQGTLDVLGPTRPFAFYGPMNVAIWAEFTTQLTTTAGSLTGVVAAAGAIAAGVSVRGANVPYGTVGTVLAGTDLTLKLPSYTFWGNTKPNVAAITGISDTSKLGGSTVSGYGFVGTETVTVGTASIAGSYPGAPNSVPGILIPSVAPTLGTPFNDQPYPFVFALAASGAIATGADAAAAFMGEAIGLVGSVQLERSFDGGWTWIPCNIGGSGAIAKWSTASPISFAFGEPERAVLYRLNVTVQSASVGTSLKYRISETGQAATSLSVPTL